MREVRYTWSETKYRAAGVSVSPALAHTATTKQPPLQLQMTSRNPDSSDDPVGGASSTVGTPFSNVV